MKSLVEVRVIKSVLSVHKSVLFKQCLFIVILANTHKTSHPLLLY